MENLSLSGVRRVLRCTFGAVLVPKRAFCLRIGRFWNHFLLLLWQIYGLTGDSALGGLSLLLLLYLCFTGCSHCGWERPSSYHILGWAPTFWSLNKFSSMYRMSRRRSWHVEGGGWLDSWQAGCCRQTSQQVVTHMMKWVLGCPQVIPCVLLPLIQLQGGVTKVIEDCRHSKAAMAQRTE